MSKHPQAAIPALGLFCLCLATLLAPQPAAAEESQQSESAEESFLYQYLHTDRFRLGQPVSPTPTPQGDAVLFLRTGPRDFVRDLFSFDVASGEERILINARQLLAGAGEQLSAEEQARRERLRLTARGFSSFELSGDGHLVLVPLSGRLYLLDRRRGGVEELPTSRRGAALDARFSPDGQHLAYVIDGELYVMDLASRRERRLLQRPEGAAGKTVTWGLPEFVAQEEMGRFAGYWWSPDGQRLAVQRTDVADLETFRIADPREPSKPMQEWAYPRAGKANAEVRLGWLPVAGGEVQWIEWDRQRYPYLATLRWSHGAPLTLLVQDRAQQEQLLLAADLESGETRELLRETDAAWLNLDQDMPQWLADGSAFLWTSERSGHWQLELRQRNGELMRELVPEGLGYRGLVHTAEDAVYVLASEDPREKHLYRLSLAAGKPGAQRLSSEPGQHQAVFSADGSVRVLTSELVDSAKRTQVFRSKGDGKGSLGTRAGELKSLQERPAVETQVEFVSIERDGTDYHAVISRPGDFSPQMRYPVLLYAYGGPHRQMVVRNQARFYFPQWLADQGFVVVSIDGRGTPNRGRDWERAIRLQMIEPALDDQVAVLQALGERYPEMDLARLGVHGWSYGGYFSAMAMMLRPKVFKAGVAGAPVADWRDYDTHYTERYMGLPQEEEAAYDDNSVLTYAKHLQGPLLILHGTADDNVYLTHSLKMSEALLRAGREHEFLPLPGQTHRVRDLEIAERMYQRTIGFFQQHLGGPVAR